MKQMIALLLLVALVGCNDVDVTDRATLRCYKGQVIVSLGHALFYELDREGHPIACQGKSK